MPKAKKVVSKKVAKKSTTKEATNKGATYNEYGTCIECQGGVEECLHNNLTETAGVIHCITCGKQIS